MNPFPYEMFGTEHLISLFVVASLGVGIIFSTKRYTDPDQHRRIALWLAALLVLPEIPDLLYRTFSLAEPIKGNLPLHLCGVSLYLSVYTLVTGSYRAFEIAYFWGLGGALMALLSPGDIFYFPHILNIIFYSSHALIVIGVLYMIFIFGYRPTWGSVLKAGGMNIIFMLLVAPLNLLLDTNYMFLRHKPKGATFLDLMGPWPWYLLGMVLFGTFIYVILYLPFAFQSRSTKEDINATE